MARALTCFALVAVGLLPAARASAQTNTGSIRGYVRGSDGQPVPDATVTAVDSLTSITRNALSNAQGFYSLNGLQPARYTVSARRIGFNPVANTILVQVGQVLSHDFAIAPAAQQLAEVTITGAAAVETRSTEAGTNVTQQQVNNLPTSSRNILDLAQLAPGVHVSPDRIDASGKTFQAGALSANQVNLYVDGQSYKNDIVTGGVAGQDASRGNPFPRNAVQELRVITNNYKAEYQKASSAIITAVTKSGGNTWEGSAFLDYQNKNLVTLDTFARVRKGSTPGFTDPDYSRQLFGASVGGPLIKDKLFFFGSYEGNFQNREGVVTLQGNRADDPPAIAGFDLASHQSPFRENLGFAKVTYNMSDKQLLEFTGSLRHESDTRDFGGQFSPPERSFSSADDQHSNVYGADLKHTYYGSNWTNEASIGYQYYLWNTDPIDFTTPQVQYNGIGIFGGASTFQHLTQKRLTARDDWTYTGWNWKGSHVIKIGVDNDINSYGFDKLLSNNPEYFLDRRNDFTNPVHVDFGFGNGVVNQHNNEFGAYIQDDWSPTSRLTFNVGVRWDLETGMYDRNYVTPQNVRDSLSMPQYQSQFIVPIDPNRYFTDGTDRKLFLGAFQPRFGVSYALDEAARTVVFGSIGIFYDRQTFNTTFDDVYNQQYQLYHIDFSDGPPPPDSHVIQWNDSYSTKAGLTALVDSNKVAREVFLVPNDLKPPKSDQWSLGVRHNFGTFNASVSYNGSHGFNGYSYDFPLFKNDVNNNTTSFNIPAYSNILLGNNDVRSWYKAMYLTLDRPYQRSILSKWGWGAGVAYTLSKAETEGGDLFSFPQVTQGFNARHVIAGVDQTHQIVGNFVTDIPYAWGIQFSGFITVASGLAYVRNEIDSTNVPGVGANVVLAPGRTPWQKSVDLRLRKDFLAFRGNNIGVTASVFNVFNTQNLTNFTGTVKDLNGANPSYGLASAVAIDPRRVQVGVQYDFK
ncbi:MAG TPA: carboxypeptidase regulatory-like domain-containing protein [Gemmatimonadaceae bacterium]|nr:carboxypeptidase regulatory-like domain-containing protein [Gemmatimonadaceae bacterium]